MVHYSLTYSLTVKTSTDESSRPFLPAMHQNLPDQMRAQVCLASSTPFPIRPQSTTTTPHNHKTLSNQAHVTASTIKPSTRSLSPAPYPVAPTHAASLQTWNATVPASTRIRRLISVRSRDVCGDDRAPGLRGGMRSRGMWIRGRIDMLELRDTIGGRTAFWSDCVGIDGLGYLMFRSQEYANGLSNQPGIYTLVVHTPRSVFHCLALCPNRSRGLLRKVLPEP